MIDPKIIDLEKRLLGDMYGRAGIFPNTSVEASGFSALDKTFSVGGANGYTIGVQNPRSKEDIHLSYPDEIEYYLCAFELVDSSGNTAEYFQFPIMPTSISIQKPSNHSVKKTNAGVVVNVNPTFIPFPIMLNGNFGRRFRKYFKTSDFAPQPENTGSGLAAGALSGINTPAPPQEYSQDYKTGYGFIKKLESIIDNSRSLLSQNQNGIYDSHRLVFYNLSFNQTYLVEVDQASFAQSRDMNVIWQYQVQMTCTAPADAIFTKERLKKSMSTMTDFNKLSNDLSNQSEGIMSLLNPNGLNTSKARKILEKQIKSRAFNALGDRKTSAITVIQQMVSNPNNADDFIVNFGNGILNKY